MTHSSRLVRLAIVLSLAACTAPPMPPPSDATIDAAPPEDHGPASFTIAIVDDDLVAVRGARITLDVRVIRTGGYAEPVLVELAGLPDPLRSLARESRPGDAITTLTIVTDEDADPTPRSAFVVQATSIEGLRQIAPAHVTVE